MKKNILLFILFSCSYVTLAQESELLAKNYYLKGEDAYNKEHFIESYYFLDKASETLGKDNSKILYLKIRSAYYAVLKEKNYKYNGEIHGLLVIFINIVNTKKYPVEKYHAIMDIKEKTKDWTQNLQSIDEILAKCKQNTPVAIDSINGGKITNIEINYKRWDDGGWPYFVNDTRVKNIGISEKNKIKGMGGKTGHKIYIKDDKIFAAYTKKGISEVLNEEDKINFYSEKIRNPFFDYYINPLEKKLRIVSISENEIIISTDFDYLDNNSKKVVYTIDPISYIITSKRILEFRDETIYYGTFISLSDFRKVYENINLPFKMVSDLRYFSRELIDVQINKKIKVSFP